MFCLQSRSIFQSTSSNQNSYSNAGSSLQCHIHCPGDAGNATELSRDWADRNLATNPSPHSPTEPLSASFSSPLAHAASAFLLFISRDICCNPFSLTKSTRFSGVYFPFLPSVITNPNHTGDEGQNQLLSDPPALISQKGNLKKINISLGFKAPEVDF